MGQNRRVFAYFLCGSNREQEQIWCELFPGFRRRDGQRHGPNSDTYRHIHDHIHTRRMVARMGTRYGRRAPRKRMFSRMVADHFFGPEISALKKWGGSMYGYRAIKQKPVPRPQCCSVIIREISFFFRDKKRALYSLHFFTTHFLGPKKSSVITSATIRVFGALRLRPYTEKRQHGAGAGRPLTTCKPTQNQDNTQKKNIINIHVPNTSKGRLDNFVCP